MKPKLPPPYYTEVSPSHPPRTFPKVAMTPLSALPPEITRTAAHLARRVAKGRQR